MLAELHKLIILMPAWQIGLLLWLLLNLFTLLMYGKDKWAAKRQWRRTPEKTLHLLAFIGGWPGAILGQTLFRHKTQKQSFRRWFYCSVIGNLLLLALVVYGVMQRNEIKTLLSHAYS